MNIRFLAPVSLVISLSSFGYILATQSKEVKPAKASKDPIVAAAGDIACAPTSPNYNRGNGTADACHMKATSNLIVNADLAAVLPLGDIQYETGTASAFQQSYNPTWGRVKSITRPAVGNHEYATTDAKDYYSYFGAAAGDPSKGYYSYNVGKWHIIALNSNCSEVGGCGAGSPQEQWLQADLKAHPSACTLAYWHHPRFSSGEHGSDSNYDAFWQDLYASGAEVVLNGHDHDYERFAPQSPHAKADEKRGIRQFVVGTGGKNHYRFVSNQPYSQVRNSDTYGVLKLTLHPQSYTWEFVPEAGKTFTDSGSGSCH
jgi:acid phosphatase type 7